MELLELIKYMPKKQIISHGNPDLTQDVNMIKFLLPGEPFVDASIYVGDGAALPSPQEKGSFTILCYGPEPDFTSYQNSSFHILYAKDTPSPYELFNEVQDVLMNIQKINAGLHMLINAFFAEQGLQYFVDVASNVFGNPMFIIDNSHKYLAVSSGIVTDNLTLTSENAAGYISEQGLSFIKRSKIDEQIRKQNAPVYFDNPLYGKGMLVDAILVNHIEVGHVMLYEQNQPFQEFDSIMLHRTSRIISMELQKNSFITQNKGFMYSYFLADLLDNPEINYATVMERLSILNYDLKDEQYILVIPARSYRNSDIKLDTIVEQLHQILPGSIYAVYENSIVIMISRYKKEGFREQEQERLLEFLQANHLTAGMSNFFYDLKNARRFYHQALKSVDLGQKLGAQAVIYYYSDHYLYHVFEMCEKEEDIRFFIHPGMMKLLEYDELHGTDFLYTLHEFLESPGQPSQIARRLHVHKNTLLYRMDKIRNIMDSPIERGDEFMSFGLSYKIMKYLKLI